MFFLLPGRVSASKFRRNILTPAKPTPHEETAPDMRRLTAAEILQAAIENARDELRRSAQKLRVLGSGWWPYHGTYGTRRSVDSCDCRGGS